MTDNNANTDFLKKTNLGIGDEHTGNEHKPDAAVYTSIQAISSDTKAIPLTAMPSISDEPSNSRG